MTTATSDVVIIGGGIVGVSAARALSRRGQQVLVLEAEPGLARHQSGRNSGVIHAGLYYRPGSEKARLCSIGRDSLYRFCETQQIPHRRCGKLVLATSQDQLPALDELQTRAQANGLDGVQRLDRTGIEEKEPAARGLAGLWIPQTGVVDFVRVTEALAKDLRNHGGEVLLGSTVTRIEHRGDRVLIQTEGQEVLCRLLINCAGLQSDRVARLAGLDPQIRLIPFRGEYFELEPQTRELVRALIYPVPDPRFPFLGVHFTRTADDRVLVGPNAVPALSREGYQRSDISFRDVADVVSFPGFWRLAGTFWRTGVAETRRSLNKQAFVREAKRLVPTLTSDQLNPAPSGVRAQAVDRSGKLLDDFYILSQEKMIHVLNAPSPAATASLAIGSHIADLAEKAI